MTRIRKWLKASVTTVTGSLILMLVTAVLLNAIGTFLSGGNEAWQGALRRAAPFLFIWRLVLYGVIFMLWRSTCRLYQAKYNEAAMVRMHRIGKVGLVVAICMELSRLIGG